MSAVRLLGTAYAAKKSHKVNMLGKGGQVGVKLHSTYTGTPFGTCKMTGTLVIPEHHPALELQGRQVHAHRLRQDRGRQ